MHCIAPGNVGTKQFHSWLHLYHDLSNSINLRVYSFPPWISEFCCPLIKLNISVGARSVWLLTRLTSAVTGPGWSPPAPTLDPSPGPSQSSHPGQRRQGASTQEQPTPPSPPSRAYPASSPPEPLGPTKDLSGVVKCLRRMLRGIAVRIVFQTS